MCCVLKLEHLIFSCGCTTHKRKLKEIKMNMTPVKIVKTNFVSKFGETPTVVQIVHFDNGTKLPYIGGNLMASEKANKVFAGWMTNDMLVAVSIANRRQMYLTIDN